MDYRRFLGPLVEHADGVRLPQLPVLNHNHGTVSFQKNIYIYIYT